MSEPEHSAVEPAGTVRPWYRSQLTPLFVGLALVSVVALAAGFGWSRDRSRSCDARSVAQRTMASVVTIFVRSAAGARSNGSGEFLDTGGHILTNNHVISSAVGGGSITVLRPNGEELPARLVGRDNDTDLAVVDVDPQSDVVPVEFGPPTEVGEPVFAIGAPMGLSDTLTAGVVGSLGRSVRVPADKGTTALITSAIQTDASINPGNSGGTLANCAGQLVGVPTAGTTPNDSLGRPVGGSIGLGFAIPGDFAHRIAEALIADGRVTHGNPGMSVVPVASGNDATRPDGLYVADVTPDGAAARAGLRQSDVVTELNGRRVTGADQLQEITLTQAPGSTVEVQYRRGGQMHTTTLTLQS
jgi:putative serine protease PepD